MINRSWGVELWDQFDNVNKYNDRTVQFYERYESFLKDRCTIEDDYARALKKLTKTYTPKPKEQEEFYNKFTFTMTFCATIKELHDLASQHELIAESMRERSIKQIQTTIKECREQRKKYLDEYQRIRRQLDKQYDLLIKSLRKYEECFDSARRAKENFEKAHEDLDLSRAQLEKAREMMNLKAKLSDDAHTSYSSQVASYNEGQRLFYERQLPTILSDLQILDGKHSDDLKHNYRQFIQAHAEVLPRIQACLDEMSKQTEQISSMTDAQVVIEEYKTGYTIPDDHQPIDLNIAERAVTVSSVQEQPIYDELTRSNTLRSTNSEQSSATMIYAVGNANIHVNGTQTLMSGSESNQRKRSGKASTIRKIFGGSNQRKSILSSNSHSSKTMAHEAPYGNLPPAQRLKKFQEHILNCKNDLDKQQKAREGLLKMKMVFQENPKFGDEYDVTQQILSMDEHIERLFVEIKRYESYIADVERTQYPALSDTEPSSRVRKNYGSNQSINNDPYRTFLQKRSSLYFAAHHMKFLNINRRWSAMVCSPDHFQSSHSNSDNLIYDQSTVSSANEYHCLPSITSLTLDSTAGTVDLGQHDDPNGSFEDEDIEHDRSLNREASIKAHALYDFSGHGIDGCQYANAASIDTGECVTVLEDDQGDGWTRIEKINGSTGFVPSSYLRLDSQPLAASFESNRF